MDELPDSTVTTLFAWIATLEAEIATIRHISERDGRNSVTDQCMETIISLEKLIVEIALPLPQPPRYAWELLIKYGEQDMSRHDFEPPPEHSTGPYMSPIVERGREHEKRRKR